MTWQSLLTPEIREFIVAHEKDDVAALALKKPPAPDWNYKLILDQIKSRQKARRKIPLWLTAGSNIILPTPNLLEQASSTATARYKASLCQAKSFADLTGGCGVDSWAMAEHAQSGYCIERDEYASSLLAHNLALLSPVPIEVRHQPAEDFVREMPNLDLVLIDPQRRDDRQKGKFRFEDCSPNILELLPALLPKAQTIIIKTSPMLDITEGIKALETAGAKTQEVHCVEWQGECKELLFILGNTDETPKIIAVSLNDEGQPIHTLTFTHNEEKAATPEFSAPLRYLYEPGTAFQKSGAFSMIAQIYGVKKLSAQTHLYTSETLVENFPGRGFEIINQYPAKSAKIPFKQAHITVRNFPMSAPDLRKKLKIKDGGDNYLFACTLKNNEKIILHTEKLRICS